MPVNYKVVKISQAGVQGGGTYKYYARVSKREKFGFRKLCEKIAHMSTFSEADTAGVLMAFVKLIPDLLKEGYTVDLSDLGLFSIYIHSEGKGKPGEVTSRSIKGAKIHFRPSVRLKQEIRNLEFRRI